MIWYLIKYRPFSSELQQVIVVSDEFTIVFGTALLVALYYYQDDPVKSFNIGMAIIGVVACCLLKNISIIMYISISNAYKKFRAWVHKKLDVPKRRKERLKKEREAERKKEMEAKKRRDLFQKYSKKNKKNEIDMNVSSANIDPTALPKISLEMNSERSDLGFKDRQELRR